MYNRHTMVMTKFAGQISKRLGSKVVELRREREWTQQQLAAATGIDQGWVSRIEAGRVEPCLGTLGLLAKAFDLSLSELLRGV
jgi:transcriptional regulator with XRE-family HTH domain